MPRSGGRVLAGLITVAVRPRVPVEEVYVCARYLCGCMFEDLQAFYPYPLEEQARNFLHDRLRLFIQHNYFNEYGRTALQAAREECINIAPWLALKGMKSTAWQPVRKWHRQWKSWIRRKGL